MLKKDLEKSIKNNNYLNMYEIVAIMTNLSLENNSKIESEIRNI
jgi:hypothetical protein